MKSGRIHVYISEVDDPWFNLAAEDWIFRRMDTRDQILFLWRNREATVLGRFQNPWIECNLKKIEEDHICLVRRQSGGGTVFHDPGNTNFSFMSGREHYVKENNFRIVIRGLKRFGIDAECSGRNDILVHGRKVSGSAFRNTVDRSFHHGTLLISADLNRLREYLSPGKHRIVSKGIASVPSTVANLKEFDSAVTHDAVCRAIIEEFFHFYGESTEVQYLLRDVMMQQPALKQYYDELRGWDWCFGKTPPFTQDFYGRCSWGDIRVLLSSKKGRIETIQIVSEGSPSAVLEILQTVLQGRRYHRGDIRDSLLRTSDAHPGMERYLAEFTEWFLHEL